MESQASFSEITAANFSAMPPKPSYWFDSDSFITPSRTSHKFSRGTRLWDFLEQKAQNHVIGSPSVVLNLELTHSDPKKADALEKWAKKLDGVLFLQPDKSVQTFYAQVVSAVNVNPQYKAFENQAFLAKADPWVIAYAKAYGGKVVTFECSKPLQKKPKIPDVAEQFGVKCITIWDALDELGFKD
jgi:hypothetical protein